MCRAHQHFPGVFCEKCARIDAFIATMRASVHYHAGIAEERVYALFMSCSASVDQCVRAVVMHDNDDDALAWLINTECAIGFGNNVNRLFES
jgi:hypothetical protein